MYCRLRQLLPRPAPDHVVRRILAIAPPQIRCRTLLGAFEGLRCQEMARLRREDVLETEGLLRVVRGKGAYERIVPLHPDVWTGLGEPPMSDAPCANSGPGRS
jgi:integrase